MKINKDIKFEKAFLDFLNSGKDGDIYTSILDRKDITNEQWQGEMLEIKGILKDFYEVIKRK